MMMARAIGRIIIVSTVAAASGDNGDGNGDGDGSIGRSYHYATTAAAVNSDADADGSIGRSIIVSAATPATDNGDG